MHPILFLNVLGLRFVSSMEAMKGQKGNVFIYTVRQGDFLGSEGAMLAAKRDNSKRCPFSVLSLLSVRN